MPRAASVCARPGCPNLSPCALHAPKPWAGRESASKRGYDWQWQKTRAAVLKASSTCYRCGAHATEVDHVVPKAEGGSDQRHNLAPICVRCHRDKTQLEASRGRHGH